MRITIQALSRKGDVARAIASLKLDTQEKLRLLLDLVGQTTITYLRSLTSELRPPVKPDGPTRRAHPGHWADITSQLALGYTYEVYDEGESVVLALRNVTEYAAFVDAKDGYFVLRGITDKGGIVEKAITRAIPIVAPGWSWRTV